MPNQALSPPPRRSAGRSYTAREQRRRRVMRSRILLLITAGCSLIAFIVFVITGLARVYREDETPVQETEKTYFSYWNTQYEADPAYPASALLPEDFTASDGRVRYTGGFLPTHAGIDVSAHNGEIDWKAAAADGVDFAMIRVGYRGYTEGEIYEDERFAENYAGAKAAGLKVGAYFFSQARSVREAMEEADFTLKILKGLELDLPVAYDWELIGQENARADDIDRDTLTACTAEYCSRVGRYFDAMIYTNAYQCYHLLDLGQLADYPIWFAGYADAPILYYRFVIWQYSDAGTVRGIEKPTDLNLCFF